MNYYQVGEWNPDKPYMFNGICFDPRDGSGNVTQLSNTNYSGMVAFVEPQTFLDLAYPLHPREVRDSVRYFHRTLPQKEICIAPPALWIGDYFNGLAVVGHEGRHRTITMLELGFELQPIYIYFEGKRARHVDEELLEKFRVVLSENKRRYVDVDASFIVLNEKVLVRAVNKRHADAQEKIWNDIKPISVETTPTRRGSKPK